MVVVTETGQWSVRIYIALPQEPVWLWLSCNSNVEQREYLT